MGARSTLIALTLSRERRRPMGKADPQHKSAIGHGIYGIPEASRYTRVHTATIRSWFRASGKRQRLFESEYPVVCGRHAISFHDLIDVWVVGALRDAGVSMQRIRQAHRVLENELATKHPFAHLKLFTDGKTILASAAEYMDDDELREIISRQQWFPRSMLPRLKEIEYGSDSLANRWMLFPNVVIDPTISLGKPVVNGTSTSSFVIARQVQANHNDLELVAGLYGISKQQAEAAVQFERQFASAA